MFLFPVKTWRPFRIISIDEIRKYIADMNFQFETCFFDFINREESAVQDKIRRFDVNYFGFNYPL